jgi:hypothetical protein
MILRRLYGNWIFRVVEELVVGIDEGPVAGNAAEDQSFSAQRHDSAVGEPPGGVHIVGGVVLVVEGRLHEFVFALNADCLEHLHDLLAGIFVRRACRIALPAKIVSPSSGAAETSVLRSNPAIQHLFARRYSMWALETSHSTAVTVWTVLAGTQAR